MAIIEVNDLVKEFVVVRKKTGLGSALRSLVLPDKTIVRGVDGLSFDIEQGDIVGYIGPNGAGKSTTIKMLTGILHPTSGSIRVCGLSPQKERKNVVRQLGVVFGQRTQLYWDLRLGETFELLKRIYRIEDNRFKATLDMLNDVLRIQDFIDTPVRQLSLGQRMRGDLAASMIHEPTVLFLDEPTIGLDADAKHAIRRFIRTMNRERRMTVVLTTHDLDDVEQLCSRLLVVNHGRIVEDGPLDAIVGKLAPHRLLEIELSEAAQAPEHERAKIVRQDGLKVWYQFDKAGITAAELIADLSGKLPIRDLSVQEPDIEDAIREVYRTTG
ncbi:ATP-binding cassette domain-containing protein [Paenibacillus sp. LHD-117]|uniref:ABC transporter ATP-binding protein n=1 Tax=Paenibacillus sp. LHD-117 TaxID=3071412 RepID=UPI0027DF3D93|nr:ATP-binding cassette domain-containing protein [Paenibacillus sp. LHD-117]MDQ6421258.1 ATP-binding cassette domain-containing protein [Paenibacillus sp. LHD-117]